MLVLAMLLLSACMGGRAAPSGAIVVFADSSLRMAFTEIATGFEKSTPGVKVVFKFAGSQELAAQIGADAPVDLYAAAGIAAMDAAVATQRVPSIDVHTFARGQPDAGAAAAQYAAAPLVDSEQPELAHAFMAYLLGPEGQAALARQGFAPP